MSLYLNGTSVDDSTLIAVVWSARQTELLIMTPVATPAIDVQDDNRWIPLSEY